MPFNYRPTALAIAQRNKVDPAARKTVVITGASSGIGLAAATALALTGWRVICAVRSVDKMNKLIESLNLPTGSGSIETMELDLTSFDSVRAFAKTLLSREDVPQINALALNAGLVGDSWVLTKDGYEQAFQTCHLSHHLLLRLLEDRLVASAPSRVVLVSSFAHVSASKYDWPREGHKGFRSDSGKSFSNMAQYGMSKVANIHLAVAFAKRMKGKEVSVFTHHPGAVDSSIWPSWVIGRSLYMLSIEQGAATLVYQLTDPRFGGKDLPTTYWNPSIFGLPHQLTASRFARNEEVAQRLWDETDRIVFPASEVKIN